MCMTDLPDCPSCGRDESHALGTTYAMSQLLRHHFSTFTWECSQVALFVNVPRYVQAWHLQISYDTSLSTSIFTAACFRQPLHRSIRLEREIQGPEHSYPKDFHRPIRRRCIRTRVCHDISKPSYMRKTKHPECQSPCVLQGLFERKCRRSRKL